MQENKNIIYWVLGAIVIIAIGFFAYTKLNRVENEPLEIEENTEEPIVVDVDGGDIEITEEPLPDPKPKVPAPSLTGALNFDSTFPDEVRGVMIQKITELRTSLKSNPEDLDVWINLGNQYKAIGDLEKAREAWEYVSVLSESSISLSNLGDLYGYYLNKPQEAENYFLRAVESNPTDIYLYFKTKDFYLDVYKDRQKAKDIVSLGIKNNPDSTDLKNLLDSI